MSSSTPLGSDLRARPSTFLAPDDWQIRNRFAFGRRSTRAAFSILPLAAIRIRRCGRLTTDQSGHVNHAEHRISHGRADARFKPIEVLGILLSFVGDGACVRQLGGPNLSTWRQDQAANYGSGEPIRLTCSVATSLLREIAAPDRSRQETRRRAVPSGADNLAEQRKCRLAGSSGLSGATLAES